MLKAKCLEGRRLGLCNRPRPVRLELRQQINDDPLSPVQAACGKEGPFQLRDPLPLFRQKVFIAPRFLTCIEVSGVAQLPAQVGCGGSAGVVMPFATRDRRVDIRCMRPTPDHQEPHSVKELLPCPPSRRLVRRRP
jgi:hypothetical protein